jgi:hypothetical protein
MPNIVQIPLQVIETQLRNSVITSPIEVHFKQDGVKVHFETQDAFAQASIELRGSKVVVIVRASVLKEPQIITVFDFAAPQQGHEDRPATLPESRDESE